MVKSLQGVYRQLITKVISIVIIVISSLSLMGIYFVDLLSRS